MVKNDTSLSKDRSLKAFLRSSDSDSEQTSQQFDCESVVAWQFLVCDDVNKNMMTHKFPTNIAMQMKTTNK